MVCEKCGKEIKKHDDILEIVSKKKVWKHWIFGWDNKVISTYHLDCYEVSEDG